MGIDIVVVWRITWCLGLVLTLKVVSDRGFGGMSMWMSLEVTPMEAGGQWVYDAKESAGAISL